MKKSKLENEVSSAVANCNTIRIRDYSDYDPDLCHDGGKYLTGENFHRVNEDFWSHEDYTSGDYCPYCGSFDCNGDCEQAEAAAEELYSTDEVVEILMNDLKNNYENVDIIYK